MNPGGGGQARIDALLAAAGQLPVVSFNRELRALMIERCGICRTAAGLRAGLAAAGPNPELEKALRVADFFGLAQLMLRDALAREESCGAHFREEHQSIDGEAQRDDERFAHIAAWEYTGDGAEPIRHAEPLSFTALKQTARSYR